MTRKTKHLIVLSLDALGSVDFDLLTSLPHTRKLLKKASFCRNVMPIYPSVTYPSHTSIVTGCYPRKHGIVSNTLLQAERKSPDWYWQQSHIKVPSVIDLALEKKMKVAALLWPVTAKSKIQYNLPEIFANRPWQHQITVSLCNGSPFYSLKMNQLFSKYRNGRAQPELDNFIHECAKYTIKKYRPDLTLVHFTDLDATKHHYGCSSSEREEAIVRLDNRIGEFVELLKVEGIHEDSTLILLGDHSQLDAHTIVYLNELFHRNKLLTVKNDVITDYQVIAKTCDGSTYIYMKDPSDTWTLEKAHRILSKFASEPKNGLSNIFTSKEAAEMGADPKCTWMIEASLGYYFLDEVGQGLQKEIDRSELHQYSHALIGVHGYLPTLSNYQTVFIAAGAGIKENIEISKMGLIDEGPTFAALLGLEMKDVDGRVLQEILV